MAQKPKSSIIRQAGQKANIAHNSTRRTKAQEERERERKKGNKWGGKNGSPFENETSRRKGSVKGGTKGKQAPQACNSKGETLSKAPLGNQLHKTNEQEGSKTQRLSDAIREPQDPLPNLEDKSNRLETNHMKKDCGATTRELPEPT